MNILILPKYGQMAATTRYRFTQYLPFLEREGISYTVSPLLSDAYLAGRFQNGRTPLVEAILCYLVRMGLLLRILFGAAIEVVLGAVTAGLTIVRRKKSKQEMPLCGRKRYQEYDLLIIHCELFPFLPPVFEFALSLLRVPFVYDYDDAIFHQYDQHPKLLIRNLFANKISFIIGKAKMIFAGSPYLAEYAKRFNPSVENMPTSVSIKAYQTRLWRAPFPTFPPTVSVAIPPNIPPAIPPRLGQPFIIGWIGTPSTTPYLSEVAEALKLFCEKYPTPGQIQIKLVGAAGSTCRSLLPGVPVEVIPWTEASETTIIQSFDLGIMPLPNEPWARGKCAFKLLQYMACGIPIIASPVGMNKNVVLNTDGADANRNGDKAGLLASSTAEWVAGFEYFYQHSAEAIAMGRQGRRLVEEKYSIEKQGPRWVRLIKSCVG
jgi:glycosyltransferase involved in cell wall biosynthesis